MQTTKEYATKQVKMELVIFIELLAAMQILTLKN